MNEWQSCRKAAILAAMVPALWPDPALRHALADWPGEVLVGLERRKPDVVLHRLRAIHSGLGR